MASIPNLSPGCAVVDLKSQAICDVQFSESNMALTGNAIPPYGKAASSIGKSG